MVTSVHTAPPELEQCVSCCHIKELPLRVGAARRETSREGFPLLWKRAKSQFLF